MKMNCCAAAVSSTDITALQNTLISLTDLLQFFATSPSTPGWRKVHETKKTEVRKSFPILSMQLRVPGRQSRGNKKTTSHLQPQ